MAKAKKAHAPKSTPSPDRQTPVFFHKDWDAFGFLSNYAAAPFTAPDPATARAWPSGAAVAAAADGDAAAGDAAHQTIGFQHAEQYYMYCKAVCFGDRPAAARILAASKPGDCKDAGRHVAGYDDAVWAHDDLKIRVMEDALWHKFGGAQLEQALRGQDDDDGGGGGGGSWAAWMDGDARLARLARLGDLGRKLLATGDRLLVEAAGRDRYWGIGYGIKQGPLRYEKSWGRNQLGKSLMATRARLRALVDGPGGADGTR